MKFLFEEPKGEVYKKLIKYAIKNSDAFMFFTCNYEQNEDYILRMDSFIEQINLCHIKTRHNGDKITCWPGSISMDNRYERDIMLFKSNESAIDSLLLPKSLYKWKYPDYPEDISFFRQGFNWFATSAHEELAYVILQDDAEFQVLESLGIKFDAEEYDDLKSTFFEEY